jgi:1,2-dihydroxy-3-keto-5-methylthiopentene dioxygenase
MSNLRIYNEDTPESPKLDTSDGSRIAEELTKQGVRFERWEATVDISEEAGQDEIIEAYKPEVEKLMKEKGYKTYDVVNMFPDHPQKDAFRNKFNSEHIHSEDEVRFFVKGIGLFTLHLGKEVYEVTCEKNDLISVPAGTPHWFDMGDSPSFTCIRLFDSEEGWVANYTGSEIAKSFSTL